MSHPGQPITLPVVPKPNRWQLVKTREDLQAFREVNPKIPSDFGHRDQQFWDDVREISEGKFPILLKFYSPCDFRGFEMADLMWVTPTDAKPLLET